MLQWALSVNPNFGPQESVQQGDAHNKTWEIYREVQTEKMALHLELNGYSAS